MSVRSKGAWSLAWLALSGCAAAPPHAAELAGSQWQLVRMQSMDDAQGTTPVADPSRYTVTFSEDGRASFRMNCNRAQGSWLAVPTGDASTGSLAFGPLAGTRAMCPPPSIDEKVLRDMGFVRSYRLQGGLLHMSLQADGGIYSWRPVPR